MNIKKHAVYGILAMVSLLGLGMTQSARANLVTNGGFETGNFAGWTLSGNASPYMNVQSGFPHSGNFDAELGPVGSDGYLTQNLATTASGSYVIDFWLANGFGGTSDFSVVWDGNTVFTLTNPPAFGYTEYMVNVTASGALTQLQFAVRQDPSYFYLDDISVVPDGGSTLSLLGCALVGVAALRRKFKQA